MKTVLKHLYHRYSFVRKNGTGSTIFNVRDQCNVCEYKLLRFKAKPQKYQTLVPAKNSHIKVVLNRELNNGIILCIGLISGKGVTRFILRKSCCV